MPITYGDAGTNRAITSVTFGDAGTNRAIKEIWYGDAGTNRLVFAGVNLLGLDPQNTVTSPVDASATYTLTSGGSEQATGFASNTWLTAGSAADYEVRATVTSGTLTSGTTGSWLSLGITRAWNVTRTNNAPGTDAATITVEIRLAATGTVLATVTVTMTATVEL